MQVKIVVIDFEIPARIKRCVLAVGIPLAILAGAGAIARSTRPPAPMPAFSMTPAHNSIHVCFSD